MMLPKDHGEHDEDDGYALVFFVLGLAGLVLGAILLVWAVMTTAL